jgi:hypothetical protein
MKKLGLLAILLLATSSAQAVVILGYNSAVNDRFSSGFAGAPVENANPGFLGAGQDLSGVGWDTALATRGVTMISDQYFVCASHYVPGSQVSFYSPTLGAVVTYTVDTAYGWSPAALEAGQSQPDLRIGRLVSAIPSSAGIASYAILDHPTLAGYIGQTVYLYGRGPTASDSPRIGTNNFEGFTPFDLSGDTIDDNLGSIYFDDLAPTGESRLEGGDSGSPSFMIYNGKFALIGIHSAVGTIGPQTVSVDSFIPSFLTQMAAANLPFTVVPEPSRIMLMLVAMLGLISRRRRS